MESSMTAATESVLLLVVGVVVVGVAALVEIVVVDGVVEFVALEGVSMGG